jgi:hypothetical protein
MLKKLKELFGFPTEQEKADAKRELNPTPVVSENVFPFPTSDKPEVEAKPKAKRTPRPKVVAEKAPVKKAPAKKPVEAAAPKRPRKPKAE